jgi:CRISPR/Cas system-associated exonuclease Cas4 (RecB family)
MYILLPFIMKGGYTMAVQLVQPQKETETQLHFSYSQLNTYLLCPMKYAHQYVFGTPYETRSVALIFGKAMHRAAETFYVNLREQGEIIPVEQMIGVFEQVMDTEVKRTEVKITYKEGENLESIRDQGRALIKLFHAEINPQKIVAVEFPFTVKVPDIITGNGNLPLDLVGYFDLIESDAEGTYSVVELKTSAQRFSSLRLAYDLQATVYSYAMAKLKVATSTNATLVRYDVLVKTRKPAFEHYYVTRTEEDHQRLIHSLNHVLKAIEHRIFYRQTGWQCSDCQFKKACFSSEAPIRQERR